MSHRLLVLDILDHPSFSFRHDYEEVLYRLRPPSLDIVITDPIGTDLLRRLDPRDYIGIVVSGSFTPYSTDVGWLRDLRAFIECVREHGRIPLLGICMAHELIADMYGGEVCLNPAGSELGTRSFQLTGHGRSSPLFRRFPSRFKLQAAHSHDVTRLPVGAVPLAGNERTPYQALQYENLYGVQFHVDITAETLRRWIRANLPSEAMVAAGSLHDVTDYERWLQMEISNTAERDRFFTNFLELCYVGI